MLAGGSYLTAAENLKKKAPVSSAEEVASRAYFIYVNQGSLPGNEMQHWLTAEAELIAEYNSPG